MQLKRLVCPTLIGLALTTVIARAHADDGTVSVSTAYYKEKSTRVVQPMVDAAFDAGEHGLVVGHFLVDSITSASVAAGGGNTAFTETRYQAGGQYTHTFDKLHLGGGTRISYEPDYFSVFATLHGELDVAQKNATLNLTLAQGRDSISNAGLIGNMAPTLHQSLNTSLASLSFSQILSPNLVGALSYDLTYLRGFQANLYRSVPAAGSLVAERVPNTRWRNAAAVSLRTFIAQTKTTVIANYRFYIDDWGIRGHTPELRAIQEINSQFDVHLRYRYHHQSAADFFKAVYDTADNEMEPFLTADQKLTRQTSQLFSAKLEAALGLLGVGGRLSDARVNAMFEYTTQTTSFGNAIAGQMTLTIPFEY